MPILKLCIQPTTCTSEPFAKACSNCTAFSVSPFARSKVVVTNALSFAPCLASSHCISASYIILVFSSDLQAWISGDRMEGVSAKTSSSRSMDCFSKWSFAVWEKSQDFRPFATWKHGQPMSTNAPYRDRNLPVVASRTSPSVCAPGARLHGRAPWDEVAHR